MKSQANMHTRGRPAGQSVADRRFGAILVAAALALLLPVIALCVIDGPMSDTPTADVDVTQLASDLPSNESVTMKIDLEEGGVIDLEMSGRDVQIDTWNGDHVIVIVEKLNSSDARIIEMTNTQPINIHVTRQGRDVHIAAFDQFGHQINEAAGVAFRIVVPNGSPLVKQGSPEYDLGRLTSTIFRALRHEALRWIGR